MSRVGSDVVSEEGMKPVHGRFVIQIDDRLLSEDTFKHIRNSYIKMVTQYSVKLAYQTESRPHLRVVKDIYTAECIYQLGLQGMIIAPQLTSNGLFRSLTILFVVPIAWRRPVFYCFLLLLYANLQRLSLKQCLAHRQYMTILRTQRIAPHSPLGTDLIVLYW